MRCDYQKAASPEAAFSRFRFAYPSQNPDESIGVSCWLFLPTLRVLSQAASLSSLSATSFSFLLLFFVSPL